MFRTTAWLTVERARNGDKDAFVSLYVDYSPAIKRFARYCGASDEQARDACQEVFRRLIDGTLKKANLSKGTFRSFLKAITRNVIRESWRTSQPRLVSKDVVPPSPNLDLFDWEWVGMLLERALEDLRRFHKQLYYLLYLHTEEGLSYEEIGRLLKVLVGTVRARLHDARVQLGKLVEYQIAEYAENPDQLAEEIACLKQLIPGHRRRWHREGLPSSPERPTRPVGRPQHLGDQPLSSSP